jgi:hypothetical protein
MTIAAKQVNTFSAIYGTRRFITIFTKDRHWTLSYESSPHPMMLIYWRYEYCLGAHHTAVRNYFKFFVSKYSPYLKEKKMKWKQYILTLKPRGNYMYHLLLKSVTLHFTHRVYLRVSYDTQVKQRLFRRIWGSHGGAYENVCLLGCSAV